MDGFRPQRPQSTQRKCPYRLNLSVLRVLCGVLLTTLLVHPAFAQGTDKAIVSVNYGLQLDTQRLSESISLQKHAETAPVTATLENKGIPFFDIGMTLRIAGRLGASVALSRASDTDTADVTAGIPNPFYLDRLRPISGQVSDVQHKEVVVHTNVAYLVESPSVILVVSGGASFFNVDQDFVTDVTFTESYPFDTATFSGATVTVGSASKTGYNAAADVTWTIGESLGLGGIIRYSRATMPFTVGGIDFGSVKVGGLQAGGGLRLTF